jgi:hypothetical protein
MPGYHSRVQLTLSADGSILSLMGYGQQYTTNNTSVIYFSPFLATFSNSSSNLFSVVSPNVPFMNSLQANMSWTNSSNGFGGLTIFHPPSSVGFLNNSDHPLSISVAGNSSLMVQKGTGFVGIGTSTPISPLTVNGTISILHKNEATTGIGAYTLQNITSGTWNTALGYKTLAYTNTGSYNVAIGARAGYFTTTGNNNVFLGINAGVSSDKAITTGTGNTYLGANTSPSSSSVNGEIVIGSGIGNGANTCTINASGGLRINGNIANTYSVITSINGSTVLIDTSAYNPYFGGNVVLLITVNLNTAFPNPSTCCAYASWSNGQGQPGATYSSVFGNVSNAGWVIAAASYGVILQTNLGAGFPLTVTILRLA